MFDNQNPDNQLERAPGTGNFEPSAESLERAEVWNNSMEDAPAFAGEDPFKTPGENPATNSISTPTETPTEMPAENPAEFDQGISDASAIINYGLNAAAKKFGVEVVVQKIKNLDVSGSENPIRDLFVQLGVDSPVEARDMGQEIRSDKPAEAAFRDSVNASATINKSVEGAFSAIANMKELISEVEGADPRYEDLRRGAAAAGKGYFEFAVSQFGTQGLTELFQVLSEQRKHADEELNAKPEEQPALKPTESGTEHEPVTNPEVAANDASHSEERPQYL